MKGKQMPKYKEEMRESAASIRRSLRRWHARHAGLKTMLAEMERGLTRMMIGGLTSEDRHYKSLFAKAVKVKDALEAIAAKYDPLYISAKERGGVNLEGLPKRLA